MQILATKPAFSCANYFSIFRWKLSRPPGFSSSIAGNFIFNIELYLLNFFYHSFLPKQFIATNFYIPVMRINPPGFSHANCIIFLIFQQEFPIPLAFNYILTRCFSPVPLSGQLPTVNHICLLSHGGRGEGWCDTALDLWKCMASSCLYVIHLLISAGHSSLNLWLLLKCAFNVHIYGLFWCILTYHLSSTLPFTPPRLLRTMCYRAYKMLQTSCPQNTITRIQNKPVHTHSWSSWFLWSVVSNIEKLIVYLMGQYS